MMLPSSAPNKAMPSSKKKGTRRSRACLQQEALIMVLKDKVLPGLLAILTVTAVAGVPASAQIQQIKDQKNVSHAGERNNQSPTFS
jgi:hypothetical protein